MKKIAMILVGLSMAHVLVAQEAKGQKELGIVFRNFDSFGFTYRTGTEKALWRFSTMTLNSSVFSIQGDDSSISTFGLGVSAGREYRKMAGEKLEMRVGADIGFGYNTERRSENFSPSNPRKVTVFSPRINAVLGANYVFSEHFLIGAEVLPFISYSRRTDETVFLNQSSVERSSIFEFGVSNTSILLSAAYRF